jgi:hypothetical protein
MTGPEHPTAMDEPTFFRRRFAPLFVIWITGLALGGGIYWFEHSMPAFHDVVVPVYWIIGVAIAIGTWRWVRTRGRRDRRGRDRRRADRREETADHRTEPPSPQA